MRPDELLHHFAEGTITDAEFVVLVCSDQGLQVDLRWLDGHPDLRESVRAGLASIAAGAFGAIAGRTVVGTKPSPKPTPSSSVFSPKRSTPRYPYRNVPGMRQPARAGL